MGDLVNLQAWKDRQSGDEEPESESVTPQLISTVWLNKHGSLRAYVSLDGALTLKHAKPLPPAVMRDLARSTVIYFDALNKSPVELACKQPLQAWLEGGINAKALKCIKTLGLEVPFGATALALVVIDGPYTMIIGWVNYFDDERLIRSLKAKASCGQSIKP